jgi:threonine dehydratase
VIGLDDVRAAAWRIASRVRTTPLLAAAPMQARLGDGCELALKLECLQVTGSFKARGAISKLTSLTDAEIAQGLVTASGGNHGAAVAYAGWVAGQPATVFVPDNVAPLKARKIQGWAPGSRSPARSGTRATAPPWRSPASAV